tara:strand:- start:982 stop:1437 length:456 start_codon:yes stop_codon:yes gene_type:complete
MFQLSRTLKVIILVICLVVLGVGYYALNNGKITAEEEEGFQNSVPMEITNNKQLSPEPKTLKIVKFYAPWCGHCKTMAPEWNKFENRHLTMIKNTNIQVLSVNCDQHQEIAKAQKVMGFPTVKAFLPNGEVREFQGERNVEGFENFMNQCL